MAVFLLLCQHTALHFMSGDSQSLAMAMGDVGEKIWTRYAEAVQT